MSDIVVVGDNGTQAIVIPATPIAISVDGTLRGVQGLQGLQGIQGIQGVPGPQGGTGGIVPITVSLTAPSSPNVNDLWIDLS